MGIRMTRWMLLFVAAAGCSASTVGLDPLAWEKVAGPISTGALLGPGTAGAFDERANFTTTAVKDGSEIKLYYGGADTAGACTGINSSHWRIGLATSTDGVSFTRVPGTETGGAILDIGAAGKFDDYLTYRPFVLKDGSTYRMWYNGSRHPFNCPTGQLALDRHIGYAESTDGVHFSKFYDGDGAGGSVLPLGATGDIDEQQVGYVWVIKDGDQYKMFYSANDAQNFWRVALAISFDARHWTKVPGKQSGGSILDLGKAGAFDVACAYQPTVVKEHDSLYRMWYRGCQATGPFGGPSKGVIGYAESNDGRVWIKVFGAVLSTGTGFDSGGLTTPSVFLDGSTWSMYYAGFDVNGQYSSGLARAAAR